MESRVFNLEEKVDEFSASQEEFKSKQDLILHQLQARDLILHQLQSFMACCNGGSKGESFAATPMPHPFVKMAFPISLVKSNQVVLKLQTFHAEKIRAQEKVEEFWSKFRPRCKPKSPPCLRPTLKKFKRVRDYAKDHEDGSARFHSSSKFQGSFGFFRSELARKNEKVFDLPDKKVEDPVKSPQFLDSDCMKSKIQACVLGSSSPNGLVAAFRDKFNQFRTSPSSNRESNCKNDLAQEFIFIISVSDDGFVELDSLALQVFDERSHSADCDFQLGYHMPISDTGGTLRRFLTSSRFFTSNVQIKDGYSSKFFGCNGEVMKNGTIVHLKLGFHELILDKGGTTIQRLLTSESTRKVETILVQENACAQLFDALQPFGGFYNDALVSVSFQFTYHKGIRDKGGTIFFSGFNSMDILAVCEFGFVLNVKKWNFLEGADPLIVPVETTFLAFNLFDKVWLSSCCMCYWNGIHDNDGGLKFRDDKIQACVANIGGLVRGSFQLDYPSVWATETLMMVARMTDGKTVMSNVARKLEVADIARFLTDYGACIEGAGNNKLISKGKSQLHGYECVIAPDRIEVHTFILTATITHSCISISHVVSCQVSSMIHKLSAVGYKIKQDSHDTLAFSVLLGRGGDNLQSFEVTSTYPGFLTYLQPKLMALLTTCNGLSLAEEPVFDKSMSHLSLQRIGNEI